MYRHICSFACVLENWKKVKDANDDQTKLITYRAIYDNCEVLPPNSLSMMSGERSHQKVISSYVTSTHNLESEKGRWSKTPNIARGCKQCSSNSEETLNHFIFDCSSFNDIRDLHPNLSTIRIGDFFKLTNCKSLRT